MKLYNIDYGKAARIPSTPHKKPKKPNFFWRSLGWALSAPELKKLGFTLTTEGMEKLSKDEPILIFMNHSCFLDYKITMHAFTGRKVNIVTTFDAFIGREWPIRGIGCFPTRKFTTDFTLIRDIKYCLKELGTSVLMFPEADYSYSGKPHIVPESAAGLIKMMGVPFCMLKTSGAFAQSPIYGHEHKRKVKVSAHLSYVLTPEQIKNMSVEEINAVVQKCFEYDHFRYQQENGIIIDDKDRARGLHKILYKCPNCKAEGKTLGEGTRIICTSCKKSWELTELGFLKAESGETEFAHIPDWYEWQRECVREELLSGEYGFDVPVNIHMMKDTKGLYGVGKGRLTHDINGAHLTGCDGRLDFYKKSLSMYAIGAALYWYGVGDGIHFGDNEVTYLAVPTENSHVVIKSRLASEEAYKILKHK